MENPAYARQGFAQEMKELERDVLEMGSRAEAMVGHAVEALTSLDTTLAMDVIERDDEIDVRDM